MDDAQRLMLWIEDANCARRADDRRRTSVVDYEGAILARQEDERDRNTAEVWARWGWLLDDGARRERSLANSMRTRAR